jgi:rare lipoprotein A
MKPTANGEIFDKDVPSAAHTTLPLPSLVEVTNLDNGKKLVVRVNDRGPFVDNRIIDLSHEAARQLGYDRAGLAHVRVRYLGPAPLMAGEETRRYAELALPKTSTRSAAAPPPPPKAKSSDDVVALTSAPLTVAPPVKIAQSALAPLPKAAGPATAAASRAPLIGDDLPDLRRAEAAKPATPKVEVAKAAPAPPAPTGFRVQAGAFSTPENAEKAAARLADAGQARVEPMTRGGVTYYRVYVDGAADQDAAEALREKIADAGFPDARVLRPTS